MINRQVLLLLTSVLCLCSLYAADLKTEPTLSVSADKASVESGDSVRIQVTLYNGSGSPIIVGHPPGGIGEVNWQADEVFHITVVKENGKPATSSRYETISVWSGSYLLSQLKPGETLRASVFLTRLYDLTVPGRYTVSASIKLGGVHGQELQSNKVTLTVLAPR